MKSPPLRPRHSCSLALIVLLTATGLCLGNLPTGAADTVSTHDKEFLKNAAENDQAEIALGELGQKKGISDAVKTTGEHLVKEHKKSSEEVAHLASQKGIELKNEPTAVAKRMVDALEKKEGAAFDKEFMDAVEKSHKKAISMFENAVKGIKDPDIKSFAEKSIPELKKHLEMAQPEKAGKDKDKDRKR